MEDDAFSALAEVFRSYGLEDLASEVIRLSTEFDGPELTLQLQQTETYKKRFVGNELRRQKGLKVLSIPEYLATEEAYRQAFRSYSLGDQFTSADYLGNLMGRDVSPAEVESRIRLAGQAVQASPPEYRQALRDYYGVEDADLVPYFLDEQVGTQILERRATAAQLGATATSARTSLSRGAAEGLADQGVSAAQLSQALTDVDVNQELASARRFNEELSADDVIESSVGKDADATQKRRKLASQERALFEKAGSTSTASRAGGSY